MTPSPRILDFIRAYEKLRLKAFKPTPNDVWTIGWGHTLGVMEGDVWTVQEAGDTFATDLTKFSAGVSAAIGAAPTNQDQFDAMVSLAYNIGLGNFQKSSVRTNHIAGHYQTAAFAFSLWDKQADAHGVLQVLNGLVSRRAAEAGIYQGR
jgi:lysozyme